MYSRYAVIQKIDLEGKVKVFQAEKENMNWTFEYRRKAISSDNKDIFPFVIEDFVKLKERKPGAETCVYKTSDNDIRFCDDYCVPAGFVICILSPIGYVPSMIKFKEKTAIPLGLQNCSMLNPGYIQIYSNKSINQSGIVMFTTQNSFFSIGIDFSRRLDKYPSNTCAGYADTFEASVNLVDGEKTYLTLNDIQNICKGYESIHNIDEFLNAINEIVDVLKSSSIKEKESRLKSAKEKIESIMQGTLGVGGSIVTIADSVNNQGFAYNMLKTLFGFFSQ